MLMCESHHSRMDEVDIAHVRGAHVICYDPIRDILPVLSSTCYYNIEPGNDTKLEYDFDALEHQIESWYLQGRRILKPKVRLETIIAECA